LSLVESQNSKTKKTESGSMWQIHWDNGRATGVLPGTYEFYSEAEFDAGVWLLDMILADEDPDEARQEYTFKIVEVSSR